MKAAIEFNSRTMVSGQKQSASLRSVSFYFFVNEQTSKMDRVSDTCSYIDRPRSVDSPRPRNHPFAGGTRGGEVKFNPLSLLLTHIRQPPTSSFLSVASKKFHVSHNQLTSALILHKFPPLPFI